MVSVPRMQRPITPEEGMRDVLGHAQVVEGAPRTVRVDTGPPDQRVVAGVDGGILVHRRLEIRSGADVSADTGAVLVQSDVECVPDEEAAVGVVLGLVLVHPGEHVLPGLDLQPALDRASEPFGPSQLSFQWLRIAVPRVTSARLGALITPPGTMNELCGHWPPKIA